MKIIKRVNRVVGKKTYMKYLLQLPKNLIENSKLLDKDLKVELKNNKLIVSKK